MDDEIFEKDKRRAVRRHHKKRISKNREKYWGRDISNNERLMGMVVKTPTPCSCHQCGNQRKISGPTRKEKLYSMDNENYE